MWKGPFEEIREACERFGIDTEAGPKPVTLMSKEEKTMSRREREENLKEIEKEFGKKIPDDLKEDFLAPRLGDWEPVDECLPDTEEMVLVTCRTKKGVATVNRAYYSDGFWHGSGSMSGVVAWMPLPEPYEVGGDDD